MTIYKKNSAPRFPRAIHKTDRPIYSRLPIGLRETFAALNELPLTFLGLVSSYLGGMVLWTYFRSVGYVPDDVVALLGLGIVITALAFLFLTATVMLASMSAVMVIAQGIKLAKKQTLLTFSLFYAVLFSLLTPTDGLLRVLYLLGIYVTGFLLVFEMCKPSHSNKEKTAVAILVAFAICPSITAFLFAQMLASDPALSFWDELIFIGMLSFLAVANAVVIKDYIHLKGVLITFVAAIAAIAVILPQFTPDGTVPNWAAAQIGIRLQGTSELLVPKATCETIVARATKATTAPTINTLFTKCEEFGNQIRADVKVRSGKSWLICTREINGTAVVTPFTMTIPAKDTELVVPNRTENAKTTKKIAEKVNSCSFG